MVATSAEEVPRLEQLHQRGIANGVPGLRMMEREEFREIEPHCEGLRGLQVPTTGIVDYTVVAQKYAELIRRSRRRDRSATPRSWDCAKTESSNIVETSAGTFRARYVINCAGLYSDTITRMAGVKTELEIVPFRGEYYEVRPERRNLVKVLIYPVPDPRFPFPRSALHPARQWQRRGRSQCVAGLSPRGLHRRVTRSERSGARRCASPASGRWRASTGEWGWRNSTAPG